MKFEDFCLNKINWLVFEGCKVIGRLTTLSANNIHTHICLYVRLYVFPTGCVGISAHVHTLIFSYVLIPYSCMCIGVFFGQCHINLGVVVMHYITMRAYCKRIYIYIFLPWHWISFWRFPFDCCVACWQLTAHTQNYGARLFSSYFFILLSHSTALNFKFEQLSGWLHALLLS